MPSPSPFSSTPRNSPPTRISASTLAPSSATPACSKTKAVDLVFAPSPDEIYPAGSTLTFVEVPGISDRLDGAFRPGHLRAVATVVAKLFHIVSPEFAYFGQKDAAQVATLQAMVRDLNFPLQLVVCPTVRDSDGLALSSRNQYLSPNQRSQAIALSRALAAVQSLAQRTDYEPAYLQSVLRDTLKAAPGLEFEYAEVVSPITLEPITDLGAGALVAVAAWAGTTRLIDNIVLPPLQPAGHAPRERKASV